MVLVGVGAVMAVVAWVIVLLSPASDHPADNAPPQDTAANGPLTTLAGTQNAIPAAAEAAGHSLVELQATTSHGRVLLVGVAVAEGGLVATTADVLERPATDRHGRCWRQARIGLRGRHGQDIGRRAGQRSRGPPGRPLRHDANLDSGDPDMALTFVPAGGGAIALHCTPGAVTDVGAPIGSGPATTMPAITSSPATPSVISGEPLLNAAGAVVGMLYNADDGHRAGHLPSERPRRRCRQRSSLPEPGGPRLARRAGDRRAPTMPGRWWRRCSPAGRPQPACRSGS